MSIYALNLAQVHQTIRETLVDRVLPDVESGSARAELLSVIEMLDGLEARLDWDAGPLTAAISRTRTLAAAVGHEDEPGTDVESLHTGRRRISDALARAYTDGVDPAVVNAVADFSAADIQAEISKGLRQGLPR